MYYMENIKKILPHKASASLRWLISLGIMWTFQVIQIYSFVIRDSYKTLLDDSAHYKTNQTNKEDQYEMLRKHQAFTLKTDIYKFHELDKLANREYNKVLRYQEPFIPFKIANPRTTERYKVSLSTEITNPISLLSMDKINSISDDDYDYYDFINEDYDEVLNTTISNKTYYTKEKGVSESEFVNSLKKIFSLKIKTHNCTEEELKCVGLKAIVCLGNDCVTHRISYKVLAIRFWNIARIWFLVYIAIALPLWCTRGRCCCCLFCKFFKPLQTIEEAKIYLTGHPPGVLKTKVGNIQYEPTVRERESYEEFEHFIRTL